MIIISNKQKFYSNGDLRTEDGVLIINWSNSEISRLR